MPEEPKDAVLEASEYTYLSEDGNGLFAKIYGYAGLDKSGRWARLCAPIWMARDGTSAYFVNLSQLGESQSPDPAEIEQLLHLRGIRFGEDREKISWLCEQSDKGDLSATTVPVARGRAPEPGAHGRIDFAVDMEHKPGLVREDGSIDYRRCSLAVLMREGQLIGKVVSPTEATPGTDLFGQELPSIPGDDISVTIGENVASKMDEDEIDGFYSEIDGELVVVERSRRGTRTVQLQVLETKVVKGNVDYSTGNIEFPGNVHVEGTIMPGFSVQSDGNVVAGSVEDGAIVEAACHVVVEHGITGSQTRVTAGGSVFAMYVNEARVTAGEGLSVSEYIFNASSRAEETIVVLGKTRNPPSGLIVGGTAIAGKRITAYGIGTDSSSSTQLMAGVDASLLKQLSETKKVIEQYQAAIGKTLKSLKVGNRSPEQVRALLLNLIVKAKGPMRNLIAKSAKNLLLLQSRLETAQATRQDLEDRLHARALEGSVEVGGKAAENTVVKIGSHTMKVAAGGVSSVRFALGETEDGDEEVTLRAM